MDNEIHVMDFIIHLSSSKASHTYTVQSMMSENKIFVQCKRGSLYGGSNMLMTIIGGLR